MAAIVVRSLGPVRGVWRDAAEMYLQRLHSRLPVTWEEGAEVRVRPSAGSAAEEAVREREAERLLRGVAPGSGVVALDAQGRLTDSAGFSELLAAWRDAARTTYLLIGGHLGLAQSLRSRCALLSLSPLTFSHQMVPAILFEQLYRAQTILDGLPYHR